MVNCLHSRVRPGFLSLFLKKKFRCNSCIIIFTVLKYTIWWILVYSQSCATINWFLNIFFVIPQRNPVPISSHHLSLPLPNPCQPLIYFLFLWFCLFWAFHIKTIIQLLVFCDWLLPCCGMDQYFISFSWWIIFHWIDVPYLFIHQLTDIWVIPTIWLLWMMLLWTSVYKFLSEHIFSSSGSYANSTFNHPRNCQTIS